MTLPLTPQNIPQELTALANFVTWREEIRGGKPTKIPVNAHTGGNAAVDRPETWATFAAAIGAAARNGNKGIGFVLTQAGPYTVIDLDGIRDPETGEIEAGARAIISRLNSYTEISPSGRGVHIWVKGKLPPGRRRKGNFEVYDSDRYLTLTGAHLEGTPATIEDRQGELEALHSEIFGEKQGKPQAPPKDPGPHLELSDQELIDRAHRARNGAKFAKLWRGDWQGDYPSQSEATAALLNFLVYRCGRDPARVDRLFRQSGLMREKWDRPQTGSTWGALEIQKAIGRATEFDTPRQSPPATSPKAAPAQEAPKSPQDEKQASPAIPGGHSLSDLGNSRRLVDLHGPDLHYCYLSKKWHIWNGQFWEIDTTGEVIRRAKLTVAQVYQEAAAAGEKEREAIAKFALRSEHDQRIKGMMRLAESEPGIPITPAMMDGNPWLLNCLNGTVDLTTGRLRPHNRADLITRLAPVEYTPAAPCPLFDRFLNRIQAGNLDIISFLQRTLGYSLTGDCREQSLFMFWGGGANGKSTLLNIISDILGNYAIQTPTETLLAKKQGTIPNDLARLNGPRFVTALEVDRGRRLAESLVKQLTGQDTISARFLYGEYFDFAPQFKLFLATNHKPVIKDTSFAIWRRIRLIPFAVEIPEEEQDRELPEKLKAELPGILAWMVRGCLSWQLGGLGVPDEVTAATGEYRQEMDVLEDFLTECCIVAPGVSARAKELYQAYGKWAENSGEKKPFTQRDFGMGLKERGFQKGRGTGGKTVWYGIGLRAE